MKFALYTADCNGDTKNCVYPHKAEITNKEELVKAAACDQVYAKYKSSYRNISNFEESDVIPMDCDNDHSDNPADWVSASDLAEKFQDIDAVIYPNRNHMIPKNGKAARPKHHVLFPIQKCMDSVMYTAVKTAIQKKYPFFNENATDAARFFFGSKCDSDSVIWNEGFLQIDEDLDEPDFLEEQYDSADAQFSGVSIQEGSRNNTMSHYAGRVLKKFGVTDKAHALYMGRAE